MKRPKLNDYPVTDSRTYRTLEGGIEWKIYSLALNKYIDFMEDKYEKV